MSEAHLDVVEGLSNAARSVETDVRNDARPVGSESGPAFTTPADD